MMFLQGTFKAKRGEEDEMDKKRHNRNYHINIGKYCHSSICDEVYALTHRAVTNATIIGTIMDLIKKDKNLANEN